MAQITLQQFQENLKKSRSELLARIEKQLKLASLRMEGRSKQLRFSRFENRTGRLRQSIAGNYGIIEGRPAAILQAGGQMRGADVFYAKYIEFGTRYIRPRLFLGRSVQAEAKELLPALQKAVAAALMGKRDG
tara:strand:- start:663 stop:1061 length:399 start_codon:yes stop_codon:yes gene_type:complete